MTTEKILAVVAMYREKLEKHEIPKKRMDTSKKFGNLTYEQLLAHAHYLLDGIEQYAKDGDMGKCGRHLGAVQAIFGFALWFTLDDVMRHNMPDLPAQTDPPTE